MLYLHRADAQETVTLLPRPQAEEQERVAAQQARLLLFEAQPLQTDAEREQQGFQFGEKNLPRQEAQLPQ